MTTGAERLTNDELVAMEAALAADLAEAVKKIAATRVYLKALRRDAAAVQRELSSRIAASNA